MSEHDDRLRVRFRTLAAEDTRGTPRFSRAAITARRITGRRWRIDRALAVAAALAAVALAAVLWPRESARLTLTVTTAAAPTDFLLTIPGRAVTVSVPSIGIPVPHAPDARLGEAIPTGKRR
jgi:hypothetical protein